MFSFKKQTQNKKGKKATTQVSRLQKDLGVWIQEFHESLHLQERRWVTSVLQPSPDSLVIDLQQNL